MYPEKTKKITIGEAITLELEIAGFTSDDGTTTKKGLINQRLPLGLKYKLNQILNQVQGDRTFINDQAQKLRAELGTPEEIKEASKNPDHKLNIEFQRQIQEAVDTKKTITIPDIGIEEFSEIETDEFYPVLFKLLEG